MDFSFIDPQDIAPQLRAKIARNERNEWEQFKKEQARRDARKARAEERWEIASED